MDDNDVVVDDDDDNDVVVDDDEDDEDDDEDDDDDDDDDDHDDDNDDDNDDALIWFGSQFSTWGLNLGGDSPVHRLPDCGVWRSCPPLIDREEDKAMPPPPRTFRQALAKFLGNHGWSVEQLRQLLWLVYIWSLYAWHIGL